VLLGERGLPPARGKEEEVILVDFARHMVSTESEEELRAFADGLGMRRRLYQSGGVGLKHPHYDLTTQAMVDKALGAGAVEVSPRELVRRAWWGDGRDGRHVILGGER
jgi:hypothetical protein